MSRAGRTRGRCPLARHVPVVEVGLVGRRSDAPTPPARRFLLLALDTPEPDVLGPALPGTTAGRAVVAGGETPGPNAAAEDQVVLAPGFARPAGPGEPHSPDGSVYREFNPTVSEEGRAH